MFTLISRVTAMFVSEFSNKARSKLLVLAKKLGHDSVFGVFIAPDPTQFRSVADILKMFQKLATDKRLAGMELSRIGPNERGFSLNELDRPHHSDHGKHAET